MLDSSPASVQVWNRGMDATGGRIGDLQLGAMSKPYGRIMGSGTSAVLDTSTRDEVLAAADAFDYLGLPDLAALTRRIADADWEREHLEERYNHAFYALEYGLYAAFERRYFAHPEDFAPVEDPGPPAVPGRWTCPGTATVHELDDTCSLGPDCARERDRRFSSHAYTALHTADGCTYCPAGGDWAF
ncbi:hypothetical protein [Dactylosporangium sp. CS-033363]|uniref:hypothetical protein n=1 Tax=Dactylosporangium sp. CS-033363 TaxID=3239935 RepID=UPI003D94D896